MAVIISGTQGVTSPKLTLVGGATSSLLSAVSGGPFTYNLPTGNGTLLLSTVTLNFPTTLGSAGNVLTTDGAGNTYWAPGGGSTTLTIGSTPIASGTTGSILLNTAGVLQQIVLGTGVAAALANNTNGPNGLMVANGSGVLAPAQGGTGISSLGTGVAGALGLNTGAAGGFLVAGSTLTQGSVLFVGAGGTASQDNAKFFFNAATSQLIIGANTPVAAPTNIQLVVDKDSQINGLKIGLGQGQNATSTVVGNGALAANTTGASSTAVGYRALAANTTGSNNTAVGYDALSLGTTAANCTAVGYQAAENSTGTFNNTAVGLNAVRATTTGLCNTGVGVGSVRYNTTGTHNTGIGFQAVLGSIGSGMTGSHNNGLGDDTLLELTSGSNNVALGSSALLNLTTGNNNVAIGDFSGADALITLIAQNNHVVLGNNSTTTLYCKTAVINTSDIRDKIVHGTVPHGLDFVNQLETLSYNMRKERGSDEIGSGDKVHYGFSAQQVLALEGENPVVIDNRNPDKLFIDGASLIPILVNAIKELTAEINLLKGK